MSKIVESIIKIHISIFKFNRVTKVVVKKMFYFLLATPVFSALVATNGGTYPVGQPITFYASAQPSTRTVFNFGDGQTGGPPAGASVSHLYSSSGTYKVSITILRYNPNPIPIYSESMILYVVAPPTIGSFAANPIAVFPKTGSTLAWSVSTAGSPTLSLDQGIGPITGNTIAVKPNSTTTYTLSATNIAGTTKATCTVTVKPAPSIASFTATPTSINRGQSVSLAWTTTGPEFLFK